MAQACPHEASVSDDRITDGRFGQPYDFDGLSVLPASDLPAHSTPVIASQSTAC